MNVLTASGITSVFHYAPLHYLLFIVRSGKLRSKRELIEAGFAETHFRSTSRRQDVSRGFSGYVHLTVEEMPPIVAAKLKKGFPHFTIRIPSTALDQIDFDLCRYNIAKSRYLRRATSSGPEPGWDNGFYQDGQQLPIARGREQQERLIAANYGVNMIEVLISDSVALPADAELLFHTADDLAVADRFLQGVSRPIPSTIHKHVYQRNNQYAARVQEFLEQALADPKWRGDGLEFDRV